MGGLLGEIQSCMTHFADVKFMLCGMGVNGHIRTSSASCHESAVCHHTEPMVRNTVWYQASRLHWTSGQSIKFSSGNQRDRNVPSIGGSVGAGLDVSNWYCYDMSSTPGFRCFAHSLCQSVLPGMYATRWVAQIAELAVSEGLETGIRRVGSVLV